MRGPAEPGYDPPAGSDFADIRSHIDRPHWATEANIYFGWLGWVLLAALVLGVATLAARPRTRRARMPLAALGCVAAFATYRGFRDAINFNAENVTARAGYGYWIAVLGFLMLAISAGITTGKGNGIAHRSRRSRRALNGREHTHGRRLRAGGPVA
jgi:hypothetical protein